MCPDNKDWIWNECKIGEKIAKIKFENRECSIDDDAMNRETWFW